MVKYSSFKNKAKKLIAGIITGFSLIAPTKALAFSKPTMNQWNKTIEIGHEVLEEPKKQSEFKQESIKLLDSMTNDILKNIANNNFSKALEENETAISVAYSTQNTEIEEQLKEISKELQNIVELQRRERFENATLSGKGWYVYYSYDPGEQGFNRHIKIEYFKIIRISANLPENISRTELKQSR